MAGGIFGLIAYGAQDAYLSGDPKITFFDVKYKRSTLLLNDNDNDYPNKNLLNNNNDSCIKNTYNINNELPYDTIQAIINLNFINMNIANNMDNMERIIIEI